MAPPVLPLLPPPPPPPPGTPMHTPQLLVFWDHCGDAYKPLLHIPLGRVVMSPLGRVLVVMSHMAMSISAGLGTSGKSMASPHSHSDGHSGHIPEVIVLHNHILCKVTKRIEGAKGAHGPTMCIQSMHST